METPEIDTMQDTEARPFGADAEEMPEENDLESGDIEATEEEQAMYDLVVARAYKFAYGEGKDQTLKVMSSGENPADGIGRATAMIVRAIKKSADEAGKKIPGDILFHAATEVVEDLSEFGKSAKVFEFRDDAEDQEQTEQALFYAMKYYGEEALANGEVDQEEAQRAVQQGIQQEQQAASANVGDAVRQELPGGQPPAQPPMRGMVNGARGM
jgi:hypothetical protein